MNQTVMRLAHACLVGDIEGIIVDTKGDAKIRRAQHKDIEGVREVLSRSFEPYRSYCAKEAYKATVPPSVEIENRNNDPEIEVLVAVCNSETVGTASGRIDEEGNYIYVSIDAEVPIDRRMTHVE